MSKPSGKETESSMLDEPKNIAEQIPGIPSDKYESIGIKKGTTQKLVGKGEHLMEFEKFLVRPTVISIPAIRPGEPSESRVNGVQIVEMVTPAKKIEPELIFGGTIKGRVVLGQNEHGLFKESKIPFMYWFPKGAVTENEKLRATSKMMHVKNENGFISTQERLFIEYKGSKKLEEQIRDFEEKNAI